MTSVEAPYQDAALSAESRAQDLLSRLPLQEKVALLFHQMASVTGDPDKRHPVSGTAPVHEMIDAGMTHFNLMESAPDGRGFAQWTNALQRRALARPYRIPITFSTDPRHHFSENPVTQQFAGAFSLWPESLGFAAIGSADVVQRFADIARREYVAAGIRVSLHPQIDLATEPRWSRINATFGESADLTSRLVAAYIRGFQGAQLGGDSVSTMTKHFPGGGPQRDGLDPHFAWGKEQVYPGHNFEYHLKPFIAALEAGARQIMPYYGMPVDTEYEAVGFNYNKSVITGILRERLGFDGIVCTDWCIVTDNPDFGEVGEARAWGVEDLSRDERLVKILDAGADQFGGESCVDAMVALVRSGAVTEERIDVSAFRLLREKFQLGLFENPFVDEEHAALTIGCAEFVKAGIEAQEASVTVLSNHDQVTGPILPLERGVKIYAEGLAAEDVRGLAELVDHPQDADVAVLRLDAPFETFGQPGLAEIFHHGSLEFPDSAVAHFAEVAEIVPTIVDVYLDRPAVLTPFVDEAAAIVVNYGITPAVLARVLFGEAVPQGRLPFDLPRSDAAVEASRTDVPFDTVDPLFRFGHGLAYSERG